MEVQDGEIFGLIGFSGAGKSTLIRLINLLEKPTTGKIYIDDITIDNIKLTEDEIFVTRIVIIIIGLIALAFPIIGEFLYINSKYKCYKKAKKKQNRKLKRNSQKAENS